MGGGGSVTEGEAQACVKRRFSPGFCLRRYSTCLAMKSRNVSGDGPARPREPQERMPMMERTGVVLHVSVRRFFVEKIGGGNLQLRVEWIWTRNQFSRSSVVFGACFNG